MSGGRVATVLAVAALCAALVGCRSRTKQEWLSLFFDGVNKHGQTNAPAPELEAELTPASTNAAPAAVLAKRSEPKLVTHPPFAERKCQECHISKLSQSLKGTPC